jgi:hypothetical protein
LAARNLTSWRLISLWVAVARYLGNGAKPVAETGKNSIVLI